MGLIMLTGSLVYYECLFSVRIEFSTMPCIRRHLANIYRMSKWIHEWALVASELISPELIILHVLIFKRGCDKGRN